MELKDIAGVGEKTLLGLNKLGIENVFDLITYYPRKYFVLKRSDINLVSDGELVIIDGIVISVPVMSGTYGKVCKFVFRLQGSDKIYNVVVFNKSFLCKSLKIGEYVTVIGKYDRLRNSIVSSEIRNGQKGYF